MSEPIRPEHRSSGFHRIRHYGLFAARRSSPQHRARPPSARRARTLVRWYWDLNDRTREFAKRFFARRRRMPNDNQVAIYSSVRHYLEAVARAGTDDALMVAKAMRGPNPRHFHRKRNCSRRRSGDL
jgi:hypothetical protein